ncbi:MAG TPA: hypothetical protein VFB65_13605 [Pyrinomonadaceae bacterium]|nr:hypothetical protein [Pyrinomonadaceae bacterium]
MSLLLALSGINAYEARSLRPFVAHPHPDERKPNGHYDCCYDAEEQQFSQVVERAGSLLKIE